MKRLLAAMMTVTMLICLCQGAFAESGVEDGVLTVAMECAYAPYNWTQADDSNGAVPIRDSQRIRQRLRRDDGQEDLRGQRLGAGDRVAPDWDSLVPAVQTGTDGRGTSPVSP